MFLFQCDYLMLLADCPKFDVNDTSMKNFVNGVTQLWQLNSNKDLSNATWYQRFTSIKCDVTKNILKHFKPPQLLQVNKKSTQTFVYFLEIKLVRYQIIFYIL